MCGEALLLLVESRGSEMRSAAVLRAWLACDKTGMSCAPLPQLSWAQRRVAQQLGLRP